MAGMSEVRRADPAARRQAVRFVILGARGSFHRRVIASFVTLLSWAARPQYPEDAASRSQRYA
jgi:hypothetical protein